MSRCSAAGIISIIIPVLNEEKNIPVIIKEIKRCLVGEIFEIIFIDDGSTDATLNVLRNFSLQYSWVHYISLSRNFGHQNAIKAGLDHAHGSCVITMDGDMQHPPAIIPQMLERWRDGADVVHTRRAPEQGQSTFKKISSAYFYRCINACTSVPIESGTADFRLMSERIVSICRSLKDDVLFWRGLIPWMGFRQEYLDYTPNSRIYGSSKYNLKKMCRLAWDGISSFSLLPLRLATIVGGIAFIVSLIYLVYVVYQAVTGAALPGWASLMSVALVLGSIQLIFLGLLGEYVGKIYFSTKHHELYFIKDSDIPLNRGK